VKQAESSRKESELEIRMTKWKESNVTAHALEISRLEDSHKAEIKRVMVAIIPVVIVSITFLCFFHSGGT